MSQTPHIRLQKYIADQGIASRRAAEKLIAEGAVKVNGTVVTKMGTKVDPTKNHVEVSQAVLRAKQEKLVYIMLYKPIGYVTTTHRTKSEPQIVLDLLSGIDERVYPVGRLDKDSSGLLLLTNDGKLAFELTHPKFGHEKEYLVEAMNIIDDEQIQELKKGMPLLGKKTLPPKVTRLSPRRFLITLKEGKNRHIRRLFRKIGSGVRKLKRIRIETLSLDQWMEPGDFRLLTKKEVQHLKQGNRGI